MSTTCTGDTPRRLRPRRHSSCTHRRCHDHRMDLSMRCSRSTRAHVHRDIPTLSCVGSGPKRRANDFAAKELNLLQFEELNSTCCRAPAACENWKNREHENLIRKVQHLVFTFSLWCHELPRCEQQLCRANCYRIRSGGMAVPYRGTYEPFLFFAKVRGNSSPRN